MVYGRCTVNSGKNEYRMQFNQKHVIFYLNDSKIGFIFFMRKFKFGEVWPRLVFFRLTLNVWTELPKYSVKYTLIWTCLKPLYPDTGADHHHVHLCQSERLCGSRLPLCSQNPHYPFPASEECDNSEGQRQPILHSSYRTELHLLTR